jgi:hypothetical protein
VGEVAFEIKYFKNIDDLYQKNGGSSVQNLVYKKMH